MRSGFGYAEPHLIELHSYDAHLCIITMERYRSGHNGADSKSVCAQAHEGSNPSLSATQGTFRGAFLRGGERGLIRTLFDLRSKLKEGSHLSRKPSGSSLASGSAKNSRVGEYPSLLYSKKGLRFLLFCDIIYALGVIL